MDSGSGDVDDTGLNARFNDVRGLTMSNDRSVLFIADQGNFKVRKMVISTRAVTTFAGTGTTCSGNVEDCDGSSSTAKFKLPYDLEYVEVDGVPYLFVADQVAIRRVDMSGTVVTFAGRGTYLSDCDTSGCYRDGVGLTATFSDLHGIVFVESIGKFFVNDESVLRAVSVADATVTTYAGDVDGSGSDDGDGTSASFNEIMGIAFDESRSRLLVAANFDGLIRAIEGK